MKRRAGLALLLLGAVHGAAAHPLAPALLQFDELAPGRYAVTWRTPVARMGSADVAPRLPPACAEQGERRSVIENNEALVERWTVACGGAGLAGQALAVSGLAESGINVIVRIVPRAGAPAAALLDAAAPAFTIEPARAAGAVFRDFVAMGVAHLLTGPDHLLFLLGLVLLVRRLRPLVATITAFTVGHSLTLALAALDVVRFNPAAAELGIAASIVAVAVTLAQPPAARPLLARRPWLMAGGFGLLHGLGFAGALLDAGLPAGEVPLSLLGFNLGIELAQLLVVAAALAAAAAWRRAPAWRAPRWAGAAPVYAMGAVAACWCWERAFALLG